MKRVRLKVEQSESEVDGSSIAAAEEQYRLRSENDFMSFLRGLIIPSAHGPKSLGLCIAPFQEECFRDLEPSLRAIRDGRMPPKRRYWIERTKKASKDADLAICLLWLMAFPKRPVLCQVSAANQQQAGIIKRRAADLLHYNSWLAERVHIQQNKIIGFGGLGNVIIEATGSSGAKQGDTPDLLILNELVHVERWGVNETHMNNADGVPQGVVIISTNAGIKGTKAHSWQKNAIANQDRWTVRIFSGIAPWVDLKDVEDARRRDPIGAEHARLWLGKWISGVGGAVEDAAIDACFTLQGPDEEPREGWRYVAGLDLGISHDHSGIVVLGAHQRLQMIRVVNLRGFAPTIPNDRGQKEVDGGLVESTCQRLSKQYHISWFGYDPAAGGSFMAQHLRAKGISMREMSFGSPKNRTLMAVSFVQAIKGERIQCYDDSEGRLRRDIGKFSIVPKLPSGYVLEAVSDEWGHADVGTALLICLPKAIQFAGVSAYFSAADVLFDDGEDDDNDATATDMPDAMQDIIDAYDDIPKRSSMTRQRATINDW